MKKIILLGLCLILAACAPGPAAPPAPSEAAPTQPDAGPGLPLYLWNEAQQQHEIHLVDPATGQDVPGRAPFVVSQGTEFAGPALLSDDGQTLAIAGAGGGFCSPSGGGTACRARADMLHLIDRSGWREVTTPLPGQGWAGPLAFSPDGTRLALTYADADSSTLMLFDTGAGSLLAQQDIELHPSLIGFTADGAALALYGQHPGADPGLSQPDPPETVLLESGTLEVAWRQPLPEIVSGHWCTDHCDAPHGMKTFASWTPAAVLSPDGYRLYLVHADAGRLTTVDFESRAVRTAEIQTAQSWFETFLALTAGVAEAKGSAEGAHKAAVLSPDGERLYVVGRAMHTDQGAGAEEPLGLEVVAVESGRRLSATASEATWIQIAPGGGHLLLGSWDEPATEVLDAVSFERVTTLARWETVTSRDPEGRPLLLASQWGDPATRLAVLDPGTFDDVYAWSVDSTYAAWVAAP